LERIAPLATETLIVETHLDAMEIERPAMVMYPGTELNDDPTNWWGPNPACVTGMLRDVGFARVDFQPNPNHPANRGIFHGRR
jgi:tRNA (mo5U34)-methyltransferase